MERYRKDQRESKKKFHRKKKKKKTHSTFTKFPDIFSTDARIAPTIGEDVNSPRKQSIGRKEIISSSLIESDENDDKEVCEKCKELLKDCDRKIRNKDGDTPVEVLSILHQLQNSVQRRRRDRTEEKMKEILGRVADALQHSGMDGIVVQENKSPFNIEKQKATTLERGVINDIFKSTEATITIRKDLIIELKAWFDILRNEWGTVCGMQTTHEITEESIQHILETFQNSSEAVEKIEFLFKKGIKRAMQQPPTITNIRTLLQFTESDEDVSLSDENSTISDQPPQEGSVTIPKDPDASHNYLKRGFDKITDALQQAMDPRADVQKHFKAVRKQFKVITNAFEKQDERIEDLEGDLEKATSESINQKHHYQQQKEADLQIISRLTDENEEMEERATSLQQQLQQPVEPIVQQPIFAYDDFQRERRTTIQVDSEIESINNRSKKKRGRKKRQLKRGRLNRRHTIATNKSNLLECGGPYSYSTSDDDDDDDDDADDDGDDDDDDDGSGIVEEADDTILSEELKTQLVDMENELLIAHTKISSQEEEISDLTKQRDDNSNDISLLTNENTIKDKRLEELDLKVKQLIKELEEEKGKAKYIQEKSVKKTKEDKQTSKSLPATSHMDPQPRNHTLARIEKEWKKEVQILRDHIESEKQRYKAKLRQTFLDHKKTENHIRDDNAHTMRALYRFKRVVIKLLQQDMSMDDTPEESEVELLRSYQEGDDVTLSESAIETLIYLEHTLAKLLLTKKIEMKDSNKKQLNAARNLKEYMKRLGNTKEICEKQEQFVKVTAEQNTALTNAYQKLLLDNEWLNKKLAYQPITKYANINPTVPLEKLNKTQGQEVMQNEEAMREDKIIQNTNFERNVNAKTSSRHKMELINHALRNNRMSVVDYHRAKDIITYGSKISEQMLTGLVQRYVALHRISSIKQTMTLDPIHVRSKRFQKYLDSSHKRYEEKLKIFELRKTELRKERQDSILKLVDVMENHEGLTVKAFPYNNHLSHMAAKLAVNDIQDRKTSDTEMDDVVGKSLLHKQSTLSYWKMPPYVSNRLVRLSVPKLVDIDVNEWKRCLEYPRNKGDSRVFIPAIASLYP